LFLSISSASIQTALSFDENLLELILGMVLKVNLFVFLLMWIDDAMVLRKSIWQNSENTVWKGYGSSNRINANLVDRKILKCEILEQEIITKLLCRVIYFMEILIRQRCSRLYFEGVLSGIWIISIFRKIANCLLLEFQSRWGQGPIRPPPGCMYGYARSCFQLLNQFTTKKYVKLFLSTVNSIKPVL
jgi:hypothetical protein